MTGTSARSWDLGPHHIDFDGGVFHFVVGGPLKAEEVEPLWAICAECAKEGPVIGYTDLRNFKLHWEPRVAKLSESAKREWFSAVVILSPSLPTRMAIKAFTLGMVLAGPDWNIQAAATVEEADALVAGLKASRHR